MATMARSFFQSLYEKDPSVFPEEIVESFDRRVTDDMNEVLCKEFSEQEIGDALFQIGPLKAPGPDSFPARFFQCNWGLFKDDVIRGVHEFFRTGVMPEGVNDTAIVLIPKIAHPEKLADFRPISLCNVIYKVGVEVYGESATTSVTLFDITKSKCIYPGKNDH